MSHWFSRIFIENSINFKLILIIVFFFKNEFLYPQNQYWENLNGPDGGIIYSVALNGNDIYCCGEGGVFRSNNYGENWECIGLNDKSVHKITVVSENILAAWH